jgi:O-antigen/teichoic acid export membrane protein
VNETRRLFRNTMSQSAPVVTAFAFSFLLAPIMLSRLGLAQFGVWAVTGALAQYGRLLDLGITNSLSRFVALYEANGDRRAVEETVAIGLLAATAVGAVVLAAAALAAPLVSDLIGVLDTAEMRVVLLCSAGISVSYLFAAVLSAVPVGLRRMGPPNVAITAGNVANFVGSIIALVLSTQLTTYAVANLAAAIVGLVLTAVSLLYVWSSPFVGRPSIGRAREIVSFGVKSQTVTLAQLVNVQTDKLIIAAMLGPRTAGAYEIGNRIVQGVVSLGLLTLSALIPTATADLVKRGKQVIAEYFSRYTVRSLAIALPMFGAICVSAPYLLVAWLGEIPPDAVQIIVLLSVAFSVSMATGVAMTLTMSDGRPGLVAQTAILVVTLNIAGTLVAAPLFGLWGVLIATVAAEIVASIVFLLRFNRRYALSAKVLTEAVAWPVAVTLLTAVPFAIWYLAGGPIPEGRGPALLGLVGTGGVYGLVCWIVESRMNLLPEKLRLGSIGRRILGRRGRLRNPDPGTE